MYDYNIPTGRYILNLIYLAGDHVMITLYGIAISNYYNKVKFALLEKEIPFTEQIVVPSQSDAVLQRSPLGKIPFIKTAEGYLSESQAILEYLEDTFPAHPLYPVDPFQRAKCRELIQHTELNVELIARRLYSEALFGGTVSQETKDEVAAKLETGLKGLNRLLNLGPYALGKDFTAADVVVWPHLQLVSYASQKIYGRDLVAEFVSGAPAYMELVASRTHGQRVARDRAVALEEFFRNR